MNPARERPCGPRRRSHLVVLAVLVCGASAGGCLGTEEQPDDENAAALARAEQDVARAVWAFHSADTARDAEAVIGLLWPEFSMFADGARQGYAEVVAGSRQFMPTLDLFHTEWSDLRVTPLSGDLAIASFQFRDSIVVNDGTLIRARGPTTFVWQRRNGEWRVLYADADHYPIER